MIPSPLPDSCVPCVKTSKAPGKQHARRPPSKLAEAADRLDAPRARNPGHAVRQAAPWPPAHQDLPGRLLLPQQASIHPGDTSTLPRHSFFAGAPSIHPSQPNLIGAPAYLFPAEPSLHPSRSHLIGAPAYLFPAAPSLHPSRPHLIGASVYLFPAKPSIHPSRSHLIGAPAYLFAAAPRIHPSRPHLNAAPARLFAAARRVNASCARIFPPCARGRPIRAQFVDDWARAHVAP